MSVLTPENITLGTLTSDTSTDGVPLQGGRWVGHVVATSGTGTAKFQISPDEGTTWIDIEDSSGAVTFTASGSFMFYAGDKNLVRGNLASSGSTPSFTFYLSALPIGMG